MGQDAFEKKIQEEDNTNKKKTEKKFEDGLDKED